MSKLDLLLDRLTVVRRNGRRAMCICPAHGDSNASLSVSESGDKVLLYCFGGCSTDKVLSALGLTWADISSGLISAKKRGSFVIREREKTCSAEILGLVERYRQAMTEDRYNALSEALGVSVTALKRLGVGWDGMAHSFPMSSANGRIIGIRRRFNNGAKVCVSGSKNGLFIPAGLTGKGTLLVAEGNSDAAAALDLGYETLGRPSCNSLTNETVRFIRKHTYDRVVIIPDNDVKPDGTNPGADGGYRLAERLRLHCKDVRVVLPPAEYNDLRCWAHLSLTRCELDRLIEAAEPVQLEVHT